MKGKKETTWAVEYEEDGQKKVMMSYSRHATPEEAKRAFLRQMGGKWKDHEQKGAKLVRREMIMFPPGSHPDVNDIEK